ncbi:helix-turn-helix transcriptional regulator [Cryobacterium breve]|uniref:Helix-turn-helix transcriptional regulator n=1 Tax=Cryobacterium breve TaxID=1259258 RepID=A0ABY7NGF7_9MICO|nr:helix-turn-helix transcriptional regulator [Cryobacterium breve]WBM79911.1 helix-turn-helix transcriptional regulator [Cryobacterium breve]
MMSTEFGDFLRSRRAALTPEAVGVNAYGARRVPGLRREEIAQLVGVSVAYYTRLEQAADAERASDQMIEALIRTMRLDPDEALHLRRLARPSYARAIGVPAERPRPSILRLIAALPGPAIVFDHANDIYAWNRLGHLLLAHDLPFDAAERDDIRPNFAQRFFLGCAGPELFEDSETMAREVVGFLRYSSSTCPDDKRLSGVIGELAQRSDAFARIWAEHPVHDLSYGQHLFAHPLVGRLTLDFDVLRPAESNLRVLTYQAQPGTPDADALQAPRPTQPVTDASGDGASVNNTMLKFCELG